VACVEIKIHEGEIERVTLDTCPPCQAASPGAEYDSVNHDVFPPEETRQSAARSRLPAKLPDNKRHRGQMFCRAPPRGRGGRGSARGLSRGFRDSADFEICQTEEQRVIARRRGRIARRDRGWLRGWLRLLCGRSARTESINMDRGEPRRPYQEMKRQTVSALLSNVKIFNVQYSIEQGTAAPR